MLSFGELLRMFIGILANTLLSCARKYPSPYIIGDTELLAVYLNSISKVVFITIKSNK
jgi:hypothetical protein